MRQRNKLDQIRQVPRPKLVSEINISKVEPLKGTATSSYRFAYARVSTLEQDEALQRDALTAAGCDRILVNNAGVATPSSSGGWTAWSVSPAPAPSPSSSGAMFGIAMLAIVVDGRRVASMA